MKIRWLFILLILMTASCSDPGTTSIPPTQASTMTAVASPIEAEPSVTPTLTATIPSPTITETVPPPVPSLTTFPLPTSPQTILSNPAGIIAKFQGGLDSFLLVGGSQNGNWISSGDVAGALSDNVEYQILSAFDSLGWIPGQEIVHEHICDQYFTDLDPFYIGVSAVGVSGDWPVRPRTPVEISTDSEFYMKALADWLVEQAPSQPIVSINKIWRVDVEGNGTDEVLLNATRFAEPTGHNVEPRDYSVVLMRTVIGSEVSTIQLAGDYYSEAAVNQFPSTYNLEFIGDLNGDGKMEVVIGVSRWEGVGAMVFEIDQDQVQLVLSVMCSL